MSRTRVALRGFSAIVALAIAFAGGPSVAQDVVAADTEWTALLKKHVKAIDDGRASRVDYAGFATDRKMLEQYTSALSGVPRSTFDGMSKPRQMAFLINAYNAFTVQLILTRYPDLKSIKDLGGLFSNPWKPAFITLLGGKVSLDAIEKQMLLAPGRYDDPRVHFALNCASIGCPALRDEAYSGDALDPQLDDQARRFMSDRKRNRYDAAARTLQVSKIFDWYGSDFSKGHRGIASPKAFFARYADALADAPEGRETIRKQQADVGYTDYDWNLNDAAR